MLNAKLFQPQFTISHRLLTNISHIESAKAIIDTAPLIPAWEKTFQQDATIRTVHYGTHLEGNDLSMGQAKLIFEKAEINNQNSARKIASQAGVIARERDIQEILNYRKVLEFLNKAEKHDTYTEDEIKRIHKITVDRILSLEDSGYYRQNKVIIKDVATGQVSYRPPLPLEIPFQMENFVAWLNDSASQDIHPVLKAGIAHFEIARIHPFLDGNGRVARALATLILFRCDYDIKKFFSLEEFYDKNPLEYYQALQTASNHENHDLTAWLEYFTFGLSIELDQVKIKVKELSMDEHMLNKLGQQISLSERQIKIVEFLKNHESLYMKDASKILPQISEDTILRELKGLVEKNLIKKVGKTKGSYYILKVK